MAADSSGYDSRYSADYGGYNYVNHEYYDRNYGYGYEPQHSSAIDSREDPSAKKRKVSNLTVCVDYLRGHCSRGTHCSKAHVDFVESKDERETMSKAKFCHDYQNRGKCVRDNCRFMHVTRREEDEFLLTGYIPQSVYERGKELNENLAGVNPSYYPDYGTAYTQAATAAAAAAYGGWPPGFRGQGNGRGRGDPAYRSAEQYWTSQSNAFGGQGGWENYSYYQKPPGSQRSSDSSRSGSQQSIPVTYGSYCIDYLKGSCTKQDSCQLRHVKVVDVADRPEVVKAVFCHDFMNSRCSRPICKYIHASREEDQLFAEKGYFPESLCQRNQGKLFYSNICIENLRNQCIRGGSCHFRHTSYVEEREERICLMRSIFCHDYQEGHCSRPNCKLIHTSQEDEAHFLRTGSLPDHLCSRASTQTVETLAANGAAKPASSSSEEVEKLKQENTELKEHIHQMERLLADTYNCITLVVGDQNPTIRALLQTIAKVTPASSLATEEKPNDQSQNQATTATATASSSDSSVADSSIPPF